MPRLIRLELYPSTYYRSLADKRGKMNMDVVPNKMKSWTDPMSSFPWRRTHPMTMCSKAKNVQIIVGQLSTKAGWWDSPLARQSFSRSIASTLNYINTKLGLLSLPSLVFNKKFTTSEWTSKYMFCPTGKTIWC